MVTFIVLYLEEAVPVGAPLAFVCQADDGEHAEEQCQNAYPWCQVVWVFQGDDPNAAYCDYWGIAP